jgi:hypothetical protein
MVKIKEELLREVLLVLANTPSGTTYRLDDGKNKTIAELFLQLLGVFNAASNDSNESDGAGD